MRKFRIAYLFTVFMWLTPLFAGKNFDITAIERLKGKSSEAALFEFGDSLSIWETDHDEEDFENANQMPSFRNYQCDLIPRNVRYRNDDHVFCEDDGDEENQLIFNIVAIKQDRDFARKIKLDKNREKYLRTHPPEDKSCDDSEDDQKESQIKKSQRKKPAKKIKRSSSGHRMTNPEIKTNVYHSSKDDWLRKTRKRSHTF